MAGRLAILAGAGHLPVHLADALLGALIVTFDGIACDITAVDVQKHRFERLGSLFDALRRARVRQVVLAGAMTRPALDPAQFDPVMQALAPQLARALRQGDDALLRFVIDMFEARGFSVLGAHEVVAGLTAPAGLLAGLPPDALARADIARARDILTALSPLDVGQGAVVSGGLCLGIETLQGTDAMLRFVAETQSMRTPGGVLVKSPKRGQDLRVDMPAIGPRTVRLAARAGLRGVALAADHVLLIDRPGIMSAAEETGIFLLSQAL